MANNTLDLTKLRAVAEAGLWIADRELEDELEALETFRATFDPPTVLRMIEELERLRDALTQVRDDSRTPSEIKLWCGVALAQPAQEIKE